MAESCNGNKTETNKELKRGGKIEGLWALRPVSRRTPFPLERASGESMGPVELSQWLSMLVGMPQENGFITARAD